MSDRLNRLGCTIMFLRMTEAEIRKLAEHTPDRRTASGRGRQPHQTRQRVEVALSRCDPVRCC